MYLTSQASLRYKGHVGVHSGRPLRSTTLGLRVLIPSQAITPESYAFCSSALWTTRKVIGFDGSPPTPQEKERERDIYIYIYTYTYVYIEIYIYISCKYVNQPPPKSRPEMMICRPSTSFRPLGRGRPPTGASGEDHHSPEARDPKPLTPYNPKTKPKKKPSCLAGLRRV